mgnify:FL=1
MPFNETEGLCTNTKDKMNTKSKKILTIFLTLIALMIPIAFIFGTISDRKDYKAEALEKVASSWAREQTIDYPILYYTEMVKDKNVTNYLCLNNYNVNANINTEIRKKGIFKIPVYVADISIKGDFTNNTSNISNKNTIFEFKVTDARGFVNEPLLQIGKQQPLRLNDTIKDIKISNNDKTIPFEISYKIKGVNKLEVLLGGLKNTVAMQSDWKTPSFEGNYLPSRREITNKGFNANWFIPSIALPQSKEAACISVSLLVPVDNYTMTTKTLKYSFLLLTLVFTSYFVFEITSKEKFQIHPIQYCLLGASILIFYLLLLSISEFLPFFISYLIAMLMTLTMIFLYTHYVITKKKNLNFSLIITSLMGILYLFFYILLQLQDIALLMGSLVLFVTLGTVMYLTRNIDWYNN